jgi:hypothetical protein
MKHIDIYENKILMFENIIENLIFLYDDVESINHTFFCEKKQFQ